MEDKPSAQHPVESMKNFFELELVCQRKLAMFLVTIK